MQKCIVCTHTNSWGSVHCRACQGKGLIPANVVACFNCTNTNSWNSVHCRACQGQGYIAAHTIPCINCRNLKSWNSVHCRGCQGKGFVSPGIVACFNCTNAKSWNSIHCRGCNGTGCIAPNVAPCFNCTHAKSWNSIHCRGCQGKGYIAPNTVPCIVCSNTNTWNSIHCKACQGKGYMIRNVTTAIIPQVTFSILPHQYCPTSATAGQAYAIPNTSSEFDTVKQLFVRAQQVNVPNYVNLQLVTVERIYNPVLEQQYITSIYEMPLFHGTNEAACYGIAQTGYKMGSSGMLGGGVYFAPNPQKSSNYMCAKKRMLLCRVNLEGSKYAQNAIYQEYCIYDIKQALPVYILQVQ